MSPTINLNPSLFDFPPSAPHNKTDTSIAAAKKITNLPRTRQDELSLLRWLAARGTFGGTDEEIKEHFGWTGDYARPRRWQLVQEGLIACLGEKRKNRQENAMKVWRATLNGVHALTQSESQ